MRMLLIHGARSFLWHAEICGVADCLAALGGGHRATPWPQRGRRRRREQARPDRLGRLEAATALRRDAPQLIWAVDDHSSSQEDCTELERIMAHPSDRREATPITRLAMKAVEQRLAPRARISMMARSDDALPMGPKIRLQSDPPCRGRSEVQCHDAPRASRPRRLRRCAARSLNPCSRRGLTAAMRRRRRLRRV